MPEETIQRADSGIDIYAAEDAGQLWPPNLTTPLATDWFPLVVTCWSACGLGPSSSRGGRGGRPSWRGERSGGLWSVSTLTAIGSGASSRRWTGRRRSSATVAQGKRGETRAEAYLLERCRIRSTREPSSPTHTSTTREGADPQRWPANRRGGRGPALSAGSSGLSSSLLFRNASSSFPLDCGLLRPRQDEPYPRFAPLLAHARRRAKLRRLLLGRGHPRGPIGPRRRSPRSHSLQLPPGVQLRSGLRQAARRVPSSISAREQPSPASTMRSRALTLDLPVQSLLARPVSTTPECALRAPLRATGECLVP